MEDTDLPLRKLIQIQYFIRPIRKQVSKGRTRTNDPSIAGYIGKNDAFAEAIGDFAVAYADQTERDYQTLVDAVKSGRLPAETGI